MKLETLEVVRAAFKDATERASLPLNANEMELLVRKAAFSLHLQKDAVRENEKVLPKVGLPLRIAEAAKSAIDLRYLLRVGDVDPVFHLTELLMAQFNLLIFTVEQRGIVGACAMIEGTAFIFISSESEIESLYTCARQLGHLLTMPVRRTKSVTAILEPAHKSSSDPVRGPYERFADCFALELLIPTRGLGIALQETRKLLKVSGDAVGDVELLYLSRIFGVSFMAMARRCELARLLPPGGAVALHRFLLEEFGGPEARAKALELPPRPTVQIAPMPRSILLATAMRIRKGEMSWEQASIELSCPATYLIKASRLLSASN